MALTSALYLSKILLKPWSTYLSSSSAVSLLVVGILDLLLVSIFKALIYLTVDNVAALLDFAIKMSNSLIYYSTYF